MIRCDLKSAGLIRAGAAAVIVTAVFFLLIYATPAKASDVETAVTRDVLQRALVAAMPYKFEYSPTPGKPAAEITVSAPKVIFIPGRPGSVLVELRYKGESKLLGIKPFSGQTRPRVGFEFDHRRGALKITLQDLEIDAGSGFKLRADQLVPPLMLPLTPSGPIIMDGSMIKASAVNLVTEVEPKRLLIKIDYRFIRAPLPKKKAD